MQTQDIQQAAPPKDNELYLFRPYCQDDVHFIQNSWGSSYYKGATYHSFMSPDDFHGFHRPIREGFFDRPETTVIVCASKEDPTTILGWAAIEMPPNEKGILIHYVYVKQAFKGQGIGRELIEIATKDRVPIMFSHRTLKAETIMRGNKDKYHKFLYAPHLLKIGGHR